jgi:hypothetical protein
MDTDTRTAASTDYEAWLSAHHAKTARRVAAEARKGAILTGDILADLLDNLAAIAERDAEA